MKQNLSLNVLSLKEIDVKGKKVIVRADLNVPLDEQGKITEDTRIRETVPTLKYILDNGGSVILLSHLGRPKEKEKKLSLEIVKPFLEKYLAPYSVKFVPDCRGEKVVSALKELQPKEVLLLENLRYYKEEETPELDPSFAKELASFGEVYMNDAFGASHRSHSSIVGIPRYMKEKGIGLLMEKELSALNTYILHPEHPFVAALGGSKISTKLGVLKKLLDKIDVLLLGGGMAYTFLKAEGMSIGNSICEDSFLEEAKKIMEEAKKKKKEIVLPLDFVISKEIKEGAETQTVTREEGIPDGFEGADIGPQTRKLFEKKIEMAKTVFWNGPFGVFELEPFSEGTLSFAKTLGSLKAATVVGGGDSILALQKAKMIDKITHVSTGGGASLEWIEQGSLPGIEILLEKGSFA